MRQGSLCGAVALMLLLSTSPAPAMPLEDPLENLNRRIHAFNQSVQTNVLNPAVDLYRRITTPGFRSTVRNAVANLNEPIVALSGLAAGQTGIALNAAARFGINSTLGLGGIHDRAAAMGYPRRSFGLGDTLCGWGVPSGPFVILPLFGPFTLRDAGAWVATSAALSQAIGPDLVLGWSTTDALIGYERHQHELLRIETEALDSYAVHRTIYLQRRATVCANDRAWLEQQEEGDEEVEPGR